MNIELLSLNIELLLLNIELLLLNIELLLLNIELLLLNIELLLLNIELLLLNIELSLLNIELLSLNIEFLLLNIELLLLNIELFLLNIATNGVPYHVILNTTYEVQSHDSHKATSCKHYDLLPQWKELRKLLSFGLKYKTTTDQVRLYMRGNRRPTSKTNSSLLNRSYTGP